MQHQNADEASSNVYCSGKMEEMINRGSAEKIDCDQKTQASPAAREER